jgi:hypothetical protein
MEKDQLNDLIADRIVEVMNSALEMDPAAVYALVESRVPCNRELADHPTIQVSAEGGKYGVGLLGVLNGLAGTQTFKGQPGWGRVQAVFQIYCPEHGHSKRLEGLAVGDACPDCGQKLLLGPLECFRRVNAS